MKQTGLIFSAFCLLGLIGCEAKQANKTLSETPAQTIVSAQYITVDGLKVRYKINDQIDKPTLVLLHGFTSSLESWDGLAAELMSNYRILRIDLPGHGLTGPDPMRRYAQDDFVSTIRNLINEFELKKPTLIGNSMGGNTAWRYAARYPDDIEKLVLIGASGFTLNGLSDQPKSLPPMLENYFLNPTKFAVHYGLKTQYADTKKIPAGRVNQILEMMTMPGNGEAFVEIYQAFTLPDPTKKLAKITAPTLIIWGENDRVVPPNHANLFGNALYNSQISIIENTGHVPHEESPQQTAKAIRAFLDQ